MFLILWIAIGALVGLVANRLVNQGKGALFADLVLGVFGGLVGGFVYNVLIARGASAFHMWSLPSAALGSAVLLAAFHLLRRTGLGVT